MHSWILFVLVFIAVFGWLFLLVIDPQLGIGLLVVVGQVGLSDVVNILEADWPDLVSVVNVVVTGVLTYFLVRFNQKQTQINRMDHTSNLQTSRLRAIDDDGVDKVELRLSNSGKGAIRDISANFSIESVFVGSSPPEEKGCDFLETYGVALKSNSVDLERTYSRQQDGNHHADDEDISVGNWLPTVGNNLQGEEDDVRFTAFVNLHWNEENQNLNFSELANVISSGDLGQEGIKGVRLRVWLSYEAEFEAEPVEVLDYVVPLRDDLNFETAIRKGMSYEEFQADPSKLIERQRL